MTVFWMDYASLTAIPYTSSKREDVVADSFLLDSQSHES